MNRNYKLLFVFAIFGLGALGIFNSFIQDDAFISFRYADMFAHGEGLVWNADSIEPVEGYTNFLWTTLIAGLIKTGVDPVAGSMIIGILLGIGTLILTGWLAWLLFGNRLAALTSVVLLGTNYTFSCYMTGGLETQLHTFLIVALALVAYKTVEGNIHSFYYYLLLSFLCTASVLTRPDSVLFCIVFLIPVLRRLLTDVDTNMKKRIFYVCLILVPGAIIGGGWIIWKFAFYGKVLPNTFHIKVAGNMFVNIINGIRFMFVFLQTYWLFPIVLLMIVYLKDMVHDHHTRYLSAAVVLWCCYVIKIGGGFMEFRLLVPVMPFAFILISRLLMALKNYRISGVLAISILLGSAIHGYSYDTRFGIEDIHSLEAYVKNDGNQWMEIGRRLRSLNGTSGGKGVTIATSAAGAIPFYSGLRTVDMLGLNDHWVALHGLNISNHPGHVRMATCDYLLRNDVNLVIGHPLVLHMDDSVRNLRALVGPLVSSEKLLEDILPAEGTIVEMPLRNGYKLCMLYLVSSDCVDDWIGENGFVTYSVQR